MGLQQRNVTCGEPTEIELAKKSNWLAVNPELNGSKPRQVLPECCATRKCKPVRSHEQLCQHLVSRAPGARRADIPFGGRSTVIFSTGAN